MNIVLTVAVLPFLFVPVVLVGALFVWGAVKDGREAQAIHGD